MTAVETEFEFLQHLVMDRSAIVLSDDKEYLLQSRLNPVARDLGFATAEELIRRARDTGDRRLEERIVEAMTTNETLWFRDIHPFNALKRTILPTLVASRASARKLSIWSAASSSGQELYSVAMTLAEEFPEVLGWRLDLHGTDLSAEMVHKAVNGRYSTLEINRGLPAAMLIRYFGKDEGGYRISESLRKLCTFQTMNLAAPVWSPRPPCDVVFLRNVLIYFDLDTRRRILENIARCLASDGYLLIGSSETMMGVTDLFDQQSADGATLYRLKGAAK